MPRADGPGSKGPGTDDPLLWLEGGPSSPYASGIGNDPRWLYRDRQGSVIGVAGANGIITPYTYGPYGEPQSWAGSRFRYTGQIALPEAQLYHYKARAYDPVMGRFLQTDPIGYGDGMNIYAYVHGDPINGMDPGGTTDVAGLDVMGSRRSGGGGGYSAWTVSGSLTTYEPVVTPGSFESIFSDAVCDDGKTGSECYTLVDELVVVAPKIKKPVGRTTSRADNSDCRIGEASCVRRIICPKESDSLAGKVGNIADNVGLGSDAVAATAIIAGIATAPTGGGPVVSGLVATGAGATGRVANVVGVVAHGLDGDWAAVAGSAVSIFAGNKAGELAKGVLVSGRMFGTLTAGGNRLVQAVNTSTSLSTEVGLNIACGID